MAQKKTNDVDYSMQEKIMALYELQKIDSQIDEINKVKGELPSRYRILRMSSQDSIPVLRISTPRSRNLTRSLVSVSAR